MRLHPCCAVLLIAWVLWVEYQTIGVGDTKYKRSWAPEAAYPDDGYSKCIEDMRVLAARHAEGTKTQPNVESVRRATLLGGRESVTTELKSGGSLHRMYVCFPETVKPR